MTKTIKAGTYKVEIEFTLEEDTLETTLDNIFEDAMYNNFNDISSSDIGEYKKVNQKLNIKEKCNMEKKYTWKDVCLVNGKVSYEEFPISGEKDFFGDEDYCYQIDDFLEAVANKYGVNIDDVQTYMMDDIDFDPKELEFGAEDCGCYIDGVAEWLIDDEDEKEFTVNIVLGNSAIKELEKKFGDINDSSDAYDAVMEAITTYLEL